MIKVVMRGDTPVYTRMARSDFLMVNGDSPPPPLLWQLRATKTLRIFTIKLCKSNLGKALSDRKYNIRARSGFFSSLCVNISNKL